jgi:hypothetical protein
MSLTTRSVSTAKSWVYRPIAQMPNTEWKNVRKAAQLDELRVHDLLHRVRVRLQEAGVEESTISNLFWRSGRSITRHYSVAQIVELHGALEKVRLTTTVGGKRGNPVARASRKTGRTSLQQVPAQKKTA